MENNKKLLANIASLESKLDMYETELSYLNSILTECGFPEGISTLKQTAQELILEQKVDELS